MEYNKKDLILQFKNLLLQFKNLDIIECSQKNKLDLIKLIENNQITNNDKFRIINNSSENNINNQSSLLLNIDKDKKEIIERFYNNVKGINICLDNINKNHCGREGYWLETRMGIKHNSKNDPDINGYEMKNDTKQVTTFIDKQTTLKLYEGKLFKNNDIEIKNKYWNTFARQNSSGIKIGGWKLNTWNINGYLNI